MAGREDGRGSLSRIQARRGGTRDGRRARVEDKQKTASRGLGPVGDEGWEDLSTFLVGAEIGALVNTKMLKHQRPDGMDALTYISIVDLRNYYFDMFHAECCMKHDIYVTAKIFVSKSETT